MHARYALTFERGGARHRLRERASRNGLEIRAERPEVLVLADRQTPLMTGENGILIGQAFDGEKRLTDLASGFWGDDALPSAGRWGNFALFRTAPAPPTVYRDPSGSIPVYQVRSKEYDVFVSDAESARSLGILQNPEIDLSFAVHWLQFPFLRSERTGLRGVHELVPGCVRRRTGEIWIDELGWKPWDHAGSRRTTSALNQLAQELRRTALKSIGAQANGSTVLLQLSGGLDSSIIAASLAQAGIGFTPINFASRSSDGDERRHARAVAERFGSPLAEILECELERFIRAPAERTFRPGSNPVLVPLDEAIEQYRRESRAELLVDGGGGDNLFCSLVGAAPVLDAFRSIGPSQAWQTCGDIAKRADCTVWEVAAHALERASPARWWSWKEDRRFLRREALLPRSDQHPWLIAPPFSLPGKREHVASLVHIQHFLDRRVGSCSAVLHPLMAQPLLELCVAIPSWEWMRGGIDRAVARCAFKDLLPSSVIERRSKGSLQGLFHRFFAALLNELRDLLLGGRLVGLGLVDARGVELAFASGEWKDDEVQMRLSEMAALDLWLQSWSP